MKLKNIFSSLLLGFAALLLFAPAQALAAAFGVSPPWIENEHIKPGTNFVYVINLSANELAEDMMVDVKLNGDPEIMQWLNIQNADSIVMPKGQSIVPMRVNVSVPTNAELGEYKGNIQLTLATKSQQMGGVMNLLGGNIAVNLNVVDYDVTDYWIRNVQTETITEGNPIELNMSLKNLGNTTLRNVETKAAVIDMASGEMIASGVTDQLSGPVQPQTLGDVSLSVPVQGVAAGKYWVDVDVNKKGQSIYKNRLYMVVEPRPVTNTSVSTGVEITPDGQVLKSAAPVQSSKIAPGAQVQTSVKIRAPFTNQLIMVVIGILIVLTIIVGKMYVMIKKKRR